MDGKMDVYTNRSSPSVLKVITPFGTASKKERRTVARIEQSREKGEETKKRKKREQEASIGRLFPYPALLLLFFLVILMEAGQRPRPSVLRSIRGV